LYNDYLPKKFRIKKPDAQIKISNSNNYLAVCCLNGKENTVRISSVKPLEQALSGTP